MSRKPSRLTVGDIDRLRTQVRRDIRAGGDPLHHGGLLVALEDLRACVEHAAAEMAAEAPVSISVAWRCPFCKVLLVCTEGTGPKGGQCPGCGTTQEQQG